MCEIWISCHRAADSSQLHVDMTRIVSFAASDNATRLIVRHDGGTEETIDVRESPEELAILMDEAETLAGGASLYGRTIRPRTEH